jgi:DNA-binding GntR family transcriptional regulator
MPRNRKPLTCDHGQRRRTIVESLMSDVFHGRILAGQHLVTQELADRFGVSHTPIREALISLAGVGIIDLQPNRGAIVRQVSARDVREICQVRKALECEATRNACGRIRQAELQSLAADLKRLTSPTSRTGGAVHCEGPGRRQPVARSHFRFVRQYISGWRIEPAQNLVPHVSRRFVGTRQRTSGLSSAGRGISRTSRDR